MKKINKDVLSDAAHRLMFDLNEKELETLEGEFGVVIEQMSMISKIEGLDEVEPMTFPYDCSIDLLREDEVEDVLDREDVLLNAGSVLDNEIKLPKVVG